MTAATLEIGAPRDRLLRRISDVLLARRGFITGIAMRSAFSLMDIPFSFWTIVIGHATFCVVVYTTTSWPAFAAPPAP